MISHTRQADDLLRALGSASCDITDETGATVCYAHGGSSSSDITHETEGTICYGHLVLHLVISHTRQGVRLCSARCDITHETGGTTCYGHCVLYLVISPTKERG